MGPIVSPVVRHSVLEAVRSCCCHLPAQLTFLPMWPAGPFSFMEPARSCLPSAELIRSSAFFLPYQARGANLLVVPGREAHVGPANGHGSLQPAASECPVSLQELPLGSLLLLGSAGGMNGCSCFPHASPMRTVSLTCLSALASLPSPILPLWGRQSLLGLSLPTHTTHPKWFPPFTASQGVVFLFSQGLHRRLSLQGQKAFGVVRWMVAQEPFPGPGFSIPWPLLDRGSCALWT